MDTVVKQQYDGSDSIVVSTASMQQSCTDYSIQVSYTQPSYYLGSKKTRLSMPKRVLNKELNLVRLESELSS